VSNCPTCGGVLPDVPSAYCNSCGARLPTGAEEPAEATVAEGVGAMDDRCAACGGPLLPGVPVCPACSRPVPGMEDQAPKKPAVKVGYGCLLAIIAFVALMVATVGMAIVPVSQRLTAPIVCPAGYTESVVVTYTSRSSDGVSMSSELYCIDAADGRPVEASGFLTFLVSFLGVLLALLSPLVLLALFGTVRRALRGRPAPEES